MLRDIYLYNGCGALMTNKKNFSDLIGYLEYIDRKTNNETRIYNCGGLPVELTLPEGEHPNIWGVWDSYRAQ